MDWKATLEQDIALIKLGNRAAFEALYSKTSSKLYGLLIKMLNNPDLATDVLQESYLKIWLNSSQYQSTSGDPWPWICQLTRHCALDALRKNKRTSQQLESIDTFDESELDTLLGAQVSGQIDGQTIFSDAGYALHSCLDKLRKEPRQAIVLAYFHGFSHSELAQKMQQPLGTLKSWVKRGLKEVEKCLQE
ncbi:RNA polymerase sigma factor [Marinomonas agarivorans]|nr:RNA polymerase sigma factor [Marinomonas agarivorans]